jgi:hypothetical protein
VIKKAKYAILPMLCFFFLFYNGKTEITELKDVGIHSEKDMWKDAEKDGWKLGIGFYFVISNPPKNKGDLLCLIFNHFKSYAPDYAIEKNNRFYYHEYFEETLFTPRNNKYEHYRDLPNNRISGEYYWDNHRDDMLASISVTIKDNRQKVIFYKRGIKMMTMIWPWKAGGERMPQPWGMEAKECEN